MDDVFGWAYLGGDEIKRSDDADKQLATINADALKRGAITQEMYDTTADHIASQSMDNLLSNDETSVYGGFIEGAKEGLASDIALAGRATHSLMTVGAVLLGAYILLKLES